MAPTHLPRPSIPAFVGGILFALLLLPASAHADGIDLPLFLAFGCGGLFAVIAFQVLWEALVAFRMLHLPYRQATRLFLWANLASLGAGIPVLFLNEGLYAGLLPWEMGAYFRAYPWVAALCTVNYFVVTVLVEAWVVWHWQKRGKLAVGTRTLWSAVLAANLASYAVLAPLTYVASRPRCDIRTFTPDTSWAAQPAARLLYLDTATHHLCAINTDGSQPETIIPRPMKEYMVSGDLELCAYRDDRDRLCLYRRSTQEEQVVSASCPTYLDAASFSPSGRWVVFLQTGVLTLWDASRQASEAIPLLVEDAYWARLAWSTDETALYVRDRSASLATDDHYPRYRLRSLNLPDMHVADVNPNATPELSACYGPGGGSQWLWTHDAEPTDWKASILPGLGSHIYLYHRDGREMSIGANPGLMHMVGRWHRNVALVGGGRELLFDDGRMTYLFDISQRKAGKLVDGTDFILFTPRYRRSLERWP